MKNEVTCYMDAVELDGVTNVRLNEVRPEATGGYTRSIVFTTDLGDFRVTIRGKSPQCVGIVAPAKITL